MADSKALPPRPERDNSAARKSPCDATSAGSTGGEPVRTHNDADLQGGSTPVADAEDVEEMPPSIPPSRQRSFLNWLKETSLVVVIALVLSFLIKTFLVQAFYIPSSSMEDTLQVGDRILVNKTVSDAGLHRGDVVVFTDPGGWLPQVPQHESALSRTVKDLLMAVGILPADAGEHLIKRVIGLPGDRVACCSTDGKLTVNGTPIDEPYLKPGVVPSETDFDVTVPAGHIWVMGDNRSNSRDSRAHIGEPGGGFIPLDNLTGRATIIMWPYSHWTYLGGGSDSFTAVPDPTSTPAEPSAPGEDSTPVGNEPELLEESPR